MFHPWLVPTPMPIKESGSIFQPVYLGVRDDITTEECTTDQLKFKAESNEAAA
jgi:hypothetical protein